MKLKITSKNIDLTNEVQRHIEDKLGKLARHLPHIGQAKVEITEEKTRSRRHRFIVQVTVDSKGTLLRGEERGDNLLTAITRVADVMDRQISHYKGKLYSKGRGTSLSRGGFSQEAASSPASNKVVRVKRFAVKPMSVDEAIDQMRLLGHEFFLFLDADSQGLKLVYRRKYGNYGLIEPELG